MADLTQIMVAEAQVDPTLLRAVYRDPGITAYNRLEPRPRTENFERSLRAEVRDALWMLTRQWQMGEFEAEDAGSVIDARLLTHDIHVDRIALRDAAGRPYDESVPMEAFVEKEAIPFTYALKVQIAQYFLKLHSAALRTKYLPRYIPVYAMQAGLEGDFPGQLDSLNLYVATHKRALDGESLYKDILDGSFAAKVTVDPGDAAAITEATTRLKAWFTRQYLQPAAPAESAWHPQQLDYQFAIAAPNTGGSQVVLEAKRYHHGRLDWYAFDNILNPRPLAGDAPAAVEEKKPISFLPTPAMFKGIPNPRFWEMEDRQIDFGKLNAKTTDHLLLTFAEFGLVYGNDWFVIPYKLPVNSMCEVKGLVLTDVFGERTLIRAADEGADSEWQRWSMFNLSNKDHIGQYSRLFFLPPTLIESLESEPVEQVNFIRDEMANMAWGIEDVIPDATGKGLDGHEAADKTGVLPEEIVNSPAHIRYLLGTTVPENWIPFLPVHKGGSVQDIQFQRASMPKLGSPPRDVIKAKGVLLTEEPGRYFIHEEEIPYAGTIVRRRYQRARWYDGKTYLWIGRHRQTGRGAGSSNLRFDQIEPTKKA
jgi:hypothetical protein